MARAYKYVTKYTSPNQNARNSKIKGITCHWWGRPTGQNPLGIVNWLCDKRAGTSAHYVVSEGTVWCIVDPDRRAWHAGNSKANHTQIGIELDPNASRRAATEKTAAALIADLRATYGDLPLAPHRKWTSTECPGDWDLARLDRLARGKTAPSIPAGGTSVPATKPATSAGKLAVDGRLGTSTVKALQSALGVKADGRACEATWKALQRKVGTFVDGVVSNQSYRAKELGNGVVDRCWRFTGRGSKGSKMVVALQKKLGVKADGIWYESTTLALQKALNAGRF